MVVMAELASNLPDWDGLPMLVDMQRFEWGHRVWGHNVFTILLTASLIAWLQHRYRWIEIAGQRARRLLPADVSLAIPSERVPPMVYFLVALAAQLVHLPCDMVVSGGNGLTDWLVRPLWPMLDTGWALPLIPWGDVGPTVILMAGALGVAKARQRASSVSIVTLVGLVTYLMVRGWMRGVLVT